MVADSYAAFEQLLTDASAAGELLLLPVVRAFEAARGALEHASFTGDIHRQIRDLPDATAARLKVVA